MLKRVAVWRCVALVLSAAAVAVCALDGDCEGEECEQRNNVQLYLPTVKTLGELDVDTQSTLMGLRARAQRLSGELNDTKTELLYHEHLFEQRQKQKQPSPPKVSLPNKVDLHVMDFDMHNMLHYGPSTSDSGQKLNIGIVTSHKPGGQKYCDLPKAPYNKFAGRCFQDKATAAADDMAIPFRINHACYASKHGYTAIVDTNSYQVNRTMIPTIRSQTKRGAPVNVSSPEWAEQRAALDATVPVPPYWNKVFSLQAHLADYDWIIWCDNDMWFMNMTVSMSTFLSRLPTDMYMVTALTDGNSYFAVRNSPAGKKYIEDWLRVGLADNGSHCEHKFGTFEYHDLGFWMEINIAALQEWSGVRCDCYSDCELKSIWTCFFEYAKVLRKAGFWPELGPDLHQWANKYKKAPPIGFVGKDRDWLGLNLAWGGSKKIKSVFKAVAIHSKTPLTTISMDGSDHKLPNCFTRQHNMCVTEQNCSASFDKAGVPRASCLMNNSSNQSVGLLRPYIQGDGESGCKLPGCECWNCSCQVAADAFGISSATGFGGDVPAIVLNFWLSSRCKHGLNVKTIPTPNASRVVLAIPKFSETDCGIGAEIPDNHFNFDYLIADAEIAIRKLRESNNRI